MNKAILIGRLTKDPEAMTTKSGVSKTTFTLAIDRSYINEQGNREADFIPVVTWKTTADLCARYLSKGRQVAVDGTIQTRSYDAQDGTKRFVTEVIANHVEFLGSREGGQHNAPMSDETVKRAEQVFGAKFTEVDDDELPF